MTQRELNEWAAYFEHERRLKSGEKTAIEREKESHMSLLEFAARSNAKNGTG